MANNKNEQQEDSTIEKLNSNLTSASEKIANNSKVIYIVIAAVAVVAALILSYIFFFRNPKVNRAFEAYNRWRYPLPVMIPWQPWNIRKSPTNIPERMPASLHTLVQLNRSTIPANTKRLLHVLTISPSESVLESNVTFSKETAL